MQAAACYLKGETACGTLTHYADGLCLLLKHLLFFPNQRELEQFFPQHVFLISLQV